MMFKKFLSFSFGGVRQLHLPKMNMPMGEFSHAAAAAQARLGIIPLCSGRLALSPAAQPLHAALLVTACIIIRLVLLFSSKSQTKNFQTIAVCPAGRPSPFIISRVWDVTSRIPKNMSSSEKLGIMQPGPTGSHRYVLDFSNIIMGFESMQAAVQREEKTVRNTTRRRTVAVAAIDIW
jgi:hypothetical protein